MVGPGEVDAELEPETAEECAKYGKVIKCVIYEVWHISQSHLSLYICIIIAIIVVFSLVSRDNMYDYLCICWVSRAFGW